MLFEVVATLCAGLFAGAAIYITFVEHPARLECGTELAATEFAPSYRRAAVMQATLAAVGVVAAVVAWVQGRGLAVLAGGALLGAVIPFTVLVIFPTNRRLLDPRLDRSSAEAAGLLTRWGRLHAVRSVAGGLAFGVLAWHLAGQGAGVPRPDIEADRAALLRLHALAQTAHLEKRADLLVASFADSLLNIARGAVTIRTPAESRVRLQAYLDRSTFQEWADLAPPIIRISPDGQMAYVIVQKRVRLTARDSAGAPRAEHTIFAWVEVYEKRGGTWALMAVASTDRPGAA